MFRQVITAIDAPLNNPQHAKEDDEIVIIGGDIIESYYFSLFNGSDLFSNYVINHYSARKNEKNALGTMLTKGQVDISIGLSAIEHHLVDVYTIDYIENYVYVENSFLYGLEVLSLHNFYASKHAIYHTDILPLQ